ncbi:hypothetical protein PGQ11_010280 [Apiospora arundinis]|uniref:Helitron helicase-like domain-containing protein n=1 Tax=Apiospora arundinis TaxID=335852 RepID=A0ABR2I9C9_9PEZI
MTRTTRLPVETPAAPTREDRERRYSPGGRVEDSEETINRLRERAEKISRESQNQREGETESQEVRQWLQRHRQQREEEARRREWTNHTRLRREQARGRRTSSPNQKEAGRYSPETVAELKVAFSRVLAAADKTFQEKQAASDRREWCEPIPLERKVETVRSFLKAFHDEDDMEIAVCSVCSLQKRPRDLDRVNWRTAVPEQIRLALADTFACKGCFPEEGSGVVVPVCVRCREAFDRGRVPEACMGGLASIGCEHRYPKELEELTPLEEKLISLNASYGFITKFNVQRGQPTGPTYRKHITGHITVFPNDVESLAAVVLPHPLVAVLKDVHIMWTGPERPTPRDVSKLLTVRPQTMRTALGWLRLNNPIYKEVIVAEGEIRSWQFESGTFVPIVAYQHMVRENETAEERTRTAHVAPPGDRGRESPAAERTAEDIVEELVQGEPRAPVVSVEEAVSEETAERVFELRSTAMFPIDEEAALADQDKLAFIGHALEKERQGGSSHVGGEGEGETPSIEVRSSGERPFVRVSRGRDFADSFSPDFFLKTFPTFAEGPLRDMTLESWAKAVLRRHGGRCSRHPAFAFHVFNILVRSRNRQVAQGRVQRSAFRRVEGIYETLTPERLRQAEKETFVTGRTADADVLALMKELSLYGSRHPLSNESRLHMRKKIFALIVATGLTAVWFTINPNDINNPLKLKLAAHRGLDDEAARALLDELKTALQAATLSIHDPLGSTVFFFREVHLFLEYYVRVGRPSVFGKVSDYYATVETNDRGVLHLHGLLWFDANMALPGLIRDMADPREAEYRAKVRRFVDDVFTETLDEGLAKTAADRESKTTVVPTEATQSAAWLSAAFEEECHFVASRCQVHHHSATCVKYSFRDALKKGGEKRAEPLCRFGAPWKLVPSTGFTEDGLLEVERNHPMVNRYNQSMAVGLRHNHDITMILTRTMGMALMWYICNYATKLNAPMWKRLALASELLELIRQQQGRPEGEADEPRTAEEETWLFLLRVSNRIFTSRELSQPEVLAYLLGFGTDFSSVRNWTWVHLNSLYWACAREWAGLREEVSALGRETYAENLYFFQDGIRLPYLQAYKHRGPVLEGLCLYKYLSFVILKKEGTGRRRTGAIPFPTTATICAGRAPGKAACPVLYGRLADRFDDPDEKVFKWNAVLHLALFVPWERFASEGTGDLPALWRLFEEGLSDRLRFHVRNIALLRVSADDAAADRKLRGFDQDFEEIVDPQALGGAGLEEDGTASEDENRERQEYWNAFLDILSGAARGSSIKDMAISSALRSLNENAEAVEEADAGTGEDGMVTGRSRGRRFYTELQDIQDASLRGAGLLGRE